MIDSTLFVEETGTNNTHDVVVYALSTCGFCKRGLAFLRSHSVKFRYVYVDLLNANQKQEVKDFLSKKYNEKVAYPFLVVDDTKTCVGFTEEKWREMLSL
ncbi:MAG: glutaredoxin family protein [Spirochaetes bacterium]|nr:glutaredoxin family protein [Spirochaetota bacterium]